MAQMQSYIHQLVEQLNYALSTVNDAASGNAANVVMPSRITSSGEKSPIDTFNSIKALIIKSADIVTAYEDVMRRSFEGKYLAESDFGTFVENTKLVVEETPSRITEIFSKVEEIGNDVNSINVYIHRGKLGIYKNGPLKGQEAYGIGVGEIIEDANGNAVAKGCAWFTAGRVSFLDDEGYEVAYISSQRLYITEAFFSGAVTFNSYKLDSSDGLAFVWVGGN